MLSAGDALFRWRSYLPLGLLPLVGLAILRATYPFSTEAADLAWEACCVGPYALVRHPLYLANGIIVMGLALFPHKWILPPAVAALTLTYYALIAWREEVFLRVRFGRTWTEWADRVPRLWPAFGHFVPSHPS